MTDPTPARRALTALAEANYCEPDDCGVEDIISESLKLEAAYELLRLCLIALRKESLQPASYGQTIELRARIERYMQYLDDSDSDPYNEEGPK